MFAYEQTSDGGLRITGCEVREGRIEIPPSMENQPVTQIGDYAFARSGITSLSLPPTVRKMGRYALYQCARLEEFRFWNGLADFGAGSFTGCHAIRRIGIEFEGEEISALRDVLMEIPEELTVEYRSGSGKALLRFPEFYEEGVENTPARIIESHTHGSGLLYRNCFVSKRLQFQEYDRRFPYALGQENETFLGTLVTDRLRFPYELSKEAEAVYEEYLEEHFDRILDDLTARGDSTAVVFVMNRRRGKQGRRDRPDFSL